MSQDNKKFLNIVEKGTKLVNGHYEIPLPVRSQEVNLPNNRIQAVKRIDCLQKGMERDKRYKDDYTEVANAVDADSFNLALRYFMARRRVCVFKTTHCRNVK